MPTSIRRRAHERQEAVHHHRLDREGVGHHAEQQVAGLLLVVELERELLQVRVELDAQVVHHALADVDRQVVGGHRRGAERGRDHDDRERRRAPGAPSARDAGQERQRAAAAAARRAPCPARSRAAPASAARGAMPSSVKRDRRPPCARGAARRYRSTRRPRGIGCQRPAAAGAAPCGSRPQDLGRAHDRHAQALGGAQDAGQHGAAAGAGARRRAASTMISHRRDQDHGPRAAVDEVAEDEQIAEQEQQRVVEQRGAGSAAAPASGACRRRGSR